MKKYSLVLLTLIAIQNIASAHEPLYGFGPHVLFKGGFAPHITGLWGNNEFEHEYALGYGINSSWTVVGETAFTTENGSNSLENINLKSKYRFWMKNSPGLSKQAALITKLVIPATEDQPTNLILGLTTGQEALKFYWFVSAGYAVKFTDNDLKPGNHLMYNLALGYRPITVHYDKPDIVFFLETSGQTFQKSKLSGENQLSSGGSRMATGPTFFFTYKNFAVRGGAQFGLFGTSYVAKPKTNFKLTIELHI
jgi:hypothetical protein